MRNGASEEFCQGVFQENIKKALNDWSFSLSELLYKSVAQNDIIAPASSFIPQSFAANSILRHPACGVLSNGNPRGGKTSMRGKLPFLSIALLRKDSAVLAEPFRFDLAH